MIENQPKNAPRLRGMGCRIIVGFLAVVLGCGGIGTVFYFWLNFEYIRANFVAARAQGRVEQIYTRTREAVPGGVTLFSEEKPQSGTYAWGLSNGSPRSARVRAQQIYVATTAFNDVLATYEATFGKWGWVTLPLNNETDLLSIAFRHPSDKNLWVGLCAPVDPFHPTDPIQYIVFFDFDESTGCEGTRLGCIARRYCD